MPRVIHFEIPADNPDRAVQFYSNVFGWTFQKWTVPQDAPTGTVQYSATATDKYGRTAEWTPPGGQPSYVTIVQ